MRFPRFTAVCRAAAVVALTLAGSAAFARTGPVPALPALADTLPPVVEPRDITVWLDSTGLARISAADVDSATTDDGALDTLTVTPSLFACFDAGINAVVLTAFDPAGNSASALAFVTVLDSVPPAPACPANDTLYALPDACGVPYDYPAVEAADNCSVFTVRTGGLPPGAEFPVGTTVQQFLSRDLTGNEATCQFSVTVRDTTPPAFDPVAELVLETDSCGAVLALSPPSATDACGVDSVWQTGGPAAGSLLPLGRETVVFAAVDAAGNTAEWRLPLWVRDTVAPNLIFCPLAITQPVAATACDAVVNYVPPVASDLCGPLTSTLVSGLGPGASFPAGTTRETWIVADGSGNAVTCSFTVTVDNGFLPALDLVASPVTDAGTPNGSVDLTVSGGRPPFTFLWSNGDTLEDPAGLDTGWIPVLVFDSLGCGYADSVLVEAAFCSPPATYASVNLAANKQRVSWSAAPQAAAYRLEGRRQGTANWRPVTVLDTQRLVSNLNPGATYEWRVQTQCLDASVSAYGPVQTFTLPTLREAAMAAEPVEPRLRPNPADRFAEIAWTGEGRVLVYDARGVLRWSGRMDGGTRRLATGHRPEGLYRVVWIDAGGHRGQHTLSVLHP
jgi:hypothetical protein